MAKYIIKRLIFIIPIMIGVSIIVFFLLSLSPGDPASLVLGANASQEDLELFREQNGLNKPLPEQYLDYMSGIIQGDLGKSYATRQNVSDMISIRIWDTLWNRIYCYSNYNCAIGLHGSTICNTNRISI